MAVSRNKLLPVAGLAAGLVVISILYINSASGPAQSALQQIPLPATAGADQDTPAETLATVVASNRELRKDVQDVLKINDELRRKLGESPAALPGQAYAAAAPTNPVAAPATDPAAYPAGPLPAAAGHPLDVIGNAWGNALNTAGNLAGQPQVSGAQGQSPGAAGTASVAALDGQAGMVGYKVLPPMGYTVQTKTEQGLTSTRYVRNPGAGQGHLQGDGTAARAAQAAQAPAAAVRPADEPYYTIPENATLTGVMAMTSIIGRVPINGRVTDPMQFKAMVGRDNLAANGWELPEDLAGMVITGVAIGDMALSCSEGKVRSITFVFDDGSIRAVSARRTSTGSSTSGAADLGFISDLHGNPCIQGKFVTNAPAYLTDIMGAKGLGIAAEALAQAQTTVTNRGDSSQSSVTGSAGSFALGRMGSAATDELTKWLTERLKSSFDAVVTPSGEQLVVHLDREVAIDKPANARKIVHRTQSPNVLSGARYGLE